MYSELHMENMLEIGRIVEHMFDNNEIEYYDSKEVFIDALNWAQEFEEKYGEDNDYYSEIEEFVRLKIRDKFDN